MELVKAHARVVKLENDCALALYRSIDTPVSLSCYLLLKYGEEKQLVMKGINPDHYLDARSFALDYQAVSTLKKSLRDVGIDRDAAALEKYLECEALCERTNDRLFSLLPCTDDRVARVSRAQAFVKSVLGKISKTKLNRIDELMGYGPGTTLGLRSPTYTNKYGRRILTSTPEALDYGLFCWPVAHRKMVEGFDITVTPKLSFVPKNAKTSRTIEVQPDVNLFAQRGIGQFIRERMKVKGYNISDQFANQYLAKLGSETGAYCTLDLESASDTLSIGLVKLLLPDDWFELFAMFRTSHVQLPSGALHPLEKFSAMGNGYTWELQTLLFTAILSSVCAQDELYLSYGDDMIFPTAYADSVINELEFYGLMVSHEKTYINSPFRESCGADFFLGTDVRPVFLKQDDTNAPFNEVCYAYGNKIRSWSYRLNDGNGCSIIGLSSWLRCFTACAPTFRLIVPADYTRPLFPQGNGGFIGNRAESTARKERERGWQGDIFMFAARRKYDLAFSDGWYYANLNGISEETGNGCESATTAGPALSYGYTLHWVDLGPWQ